jgi:signal transduction histidine kinase
VLASGLADLCALALDNARLYREAQSLREIAEAANHAKTVFLGNMSHELMTPLNAIGGYVALLEMGLRGPITAEQRIDLARIQHNQAHLLTVIANILSFVRTDSDRLAYHCTACSAHSALVEVAEMLHGAVRDRAVIRVQPMLEDTLMWADADRVRQILLNLVTNAIKYGSANGGCVTLESTATAEAVCLHVIDTGIGIPADKVAVIFDPFVQLASGLSDRRGGVGLGLAISRDLARAMHGDLTVESVVGVGSRFTLSLPHARGAVSAADSTNAH